MKFPYIQFNIVVVPIDGCSIVTIELHSRINRYRPRDKIVSRASDTCKKIIPITIKKKNTKSFG